MDRYVIWTSDIDIEDYRDEMREQYPDIPEDRLYDFAHEMNDNDLECERMSLDFDLANEIICIASIGRWNGRAEDYRFLGRNLARCLYSMDDSVTWYVDEHGDFRCDGKHHDGTNQYLYREFKSGLTGRQMEYFTDQILMGKVTPAQIERYTRKIGDRIAEVYGWKVA